MSISCVTDDVISISDVKPGGTARVAMGAVHEQQLADLALLRLALDRGVAGVEAAHEADLDELTPERGLGLDDAQARRRRGGERLLAQHRLLPCQAGEHELLVGVVRGGDHDGVHAVVGDQLVRVGVHSRRLAGRRAGARGVRVGHRDDLGTLDLAAEPAHVRGAHHAGADDADPQAGHGVVPRYVRCVPLLPS